MKVRMVGDKAISDWIKSLPRGMKIAGMRAIAFWYGGREGEGLRKEPPNKFVSRAAAYGKVSDAPAGYFSWAQFRKVAALTHGFTQRYTRTHEMSNAWMYHETNSQWDKVNFTNSAPGAVWAYSEGQARQLKEVGWPKVTRIITDSLASAIGYAQSAVNALIARKGK